MPFGRGWFGRGGGWGRGNPYPFCRFYPWLPRRWWAYGMGFYPRPYGGPSRTIWRRRLLRSATGLSRPLPRMVVGGNRRRWLESRTGGYEMPYGYGFGFRGYSPPWPYIGRGRGGLPRCWHPGGYGAPGYWTAEGPCGPYAAPWPGPAPQVGRDTELDFLRQEARAAKDALDNIEARIGELESEES